MPAIAWEQTVTPSLACAHIRAMRSRQVSDADLDLVPHAEL